MKEMSIKNPIYCFIYELLYGTMYKILKEIESTDHVKQKDYIRAEAKTQTKLEFYKRLKNGHVLEKTPFGIIIMKYNIDEEGFEYYSNVQVPFSILETVSRKYVIQYKCKELYIKPHMIEVQATQSLPNTNKKNEKPLQNKYRQPLYTNAENIKEKTIKIKDRANKYIHKGHLNEFKFLQTVDKTLFNKKLKMSYADFKKHNKL
jgi:hypothetical protein